MEQYPSVELKRRTKAFAVSIVELFRSLPKTDEARIMGKQLLRSATSVAANYRAVCRARSKAEFVAKLGIVLEEIDETVFWIEILEECHVVEKKNIILINSEANQLLAIFGASVRTAKSSNDSMKK